MSHGSVPIPLAQNGDVAVSTIESFDIALQPTLDFSTLLGFGKVVAHVLGTCAGLAGGATLTLRLYRRKNVAPTPNVGIDTLLGAFPAIGANGPFRVSFDCGWPSTDLPYRWLLSTQASSGAPTINEVTLVLELQ